MQLGIFNGSLASVPAYDLGATVIKHIVEQAGISAHEISEVIIGQVLTSSVGQNPARQAAMAAGLPKETTAWNINKVCGSGLWAIALAWQSILTGNSDIVIAGGQENMSMAPHAAFLRSGIKMGPGALEDLMIKDGLTDAFSKLHMGLTAEAIAEKYSVTKEEQDKFALASQQKAAAAQKSGKFDAEIIPITVQHRKGSTLVDKDEFIRHDATLEAISALKPAFKKDGTVTAGNASGINDGAAMLMLMTVGEAKARGLEILATIKSVAATGCDPEYMGIGPVSAAKKALDRASWNVGDLELIEANEAFAAQAIAVNKLLGWDQQIVNINGGAIAIGHPIGASGARILVTLLHEMKRNNLKKGLATLCVGGGMGVAVCVEQ